VAEAESALKAINVGINLLSVRANGLVLPVGLRDEEVAWARWAPVRVDGMTGRGSWLDSSHAAAQIGELMSSLLALSADEYALNVAHYAVSYFVAASAHMTAEVATSTCVSALQMLSYVKLVEMGSVSRSKFKDMHVSEQLRDLLLECSVDTRVAPLFTELSKLVASSGATPPVDSFNAITTLRNSAVHPTRDRPYHFPVEAWGEGQLVVGEYLLLAILSFVGYGGRYMSAIKRNLWPDSSIPVPWGHG
jgi:hypothetical protein